MIFGKNARLMLKYQKAKAKMVEYDVSKQEYPRFPLNSNELSYPTTYVLSRYSECIIENNHDELEELELLLNATAEYYDSAFKSKDRPEYDWDFLLSGASAYFLRKDFGSAKVLAKKVADLIADERSPQKLLTNIYNYLLGGVYLPYLKVVDTYERINNFFLDYFGKSESLEALKVNLWVYRKEIYEKGDSDSVFYVDILVAAIIVACNNSSWNLLPDSSGISHEEWEPYLQSKMSIKMLWPAQRLIAEKGLLRGGSSIVQLPTGVGKTRSIELIIRAAFLAERANTAIIVAPLRALCNEVTMDMYKAFGTDVTINQFSDILQNDFWNLFSEDIKRQILICTPEKLSYVLHHDPLFLSAIDLFVFDEGHMFDDGGRGATYELLVTHIRQNIMSEQQLVLLSAVLPNSDDIAQWLFEGKSCLATDDSIVSTPKSIGFSSAQRDIHFFSDDKLNEDYYIPRILRVVQLNKLPKERSNKYFPDLSSSIDVAIYNAIKLCHNGGVAIYLGQQRSMKTVFERIINLDKRNYDLKPLKDNTNQAELSKIKGFIESYYGAEHYYTKAAELGVLPHSSNLQNGVKLVVEHALKNKYVSCVVCTSTLAQGVNIPIKYLLVTSIRNGLQIVKARDFQNLMGRTARAGIYTEGSIIITDCKIYDNRTNWKNGGRYFWNDCVKLFDTKFAEPCGSSILSLVQDFNVDYDVTLSGEKFVGMVIDHLGERDFLLDYAKKLEKAYLKTYPGRTQNMIIQEILLRQDIISHIENYLCLVYSTEISDNDHKKSAVDICANTLAYALATEKEKELLIKVFQKIEENLQQYSVENLRRYSNAMSGIGLSSLIEEWIVQNELTEKIYSETDMLSMIVELYLQINDDFKNQEHMQSICQKWIDGKTPVEINNEEPIGIAEIESICNKRISYGLNFLIGNVCDLIVVDGEDEKQVDPRNVMTLLQKKVKYGVPNMTAISVCESIFNDRLLAIEIAQIISDENIGTDKILSMMKAYREEIFDCLDFYPEYFKDRLTVLM
ncbi:MAG: DEAD/DEAH box helicase [Clostridium sp.]|nr:DEAD/DEAH box helicase [Clostridium sp.]